MPDYNHLMSHLYEEATAIEAIVYLAKNFHQEEKALNAEFADKLV